MNRGSYYGSYYPYPPNYSYYPPRSAPYSTPKKPLWPVALALVGILLIGYGFLTLPKLDPEMKKYAALYPDATISALLFCDPCSGIDGETIGDGRVMVIGTTSEIMEFARDPRVRQVRFVGRVD